MTTNGRIGTTAPIANRTNDATAASHGEPPRSFGSMPSSSRASASIAVARSASRRLTNGVGLARTQPLGFVDQLQLLAFALGILAELARLDPDLALSQLAGARH